jgi:magnesium-protoporphyrin O-methyltransferase
MLDDGLGGFDHVVAMDSLIHYERSDIVRVIADLSTRTRRSILFTFAPRTPALSVMHAAGKLFPRDDRAPAIEPVGQAALVQALQAEPRLAAWRIGRTQRIASGFYTSQALELVRS